MFYKAVCRFSQPLFNKMNFNTKQQTKKEYAWKANKQNISQKLTYHRLWKIEFEWQLKVLVNCIKTRSTVCR